ncbi:nipped-B-like protein B [Armigeres subalbatus]|uniref:nipped-B-like protein B n=1 Tax=Armigeres subalbatus TaxID=124917 RepID=UPI002ED6711E
MAVFGPNKRRKIPVPKRHGVRDPLKKLAEREAAIKDKINNPPKERDTQEVSNRFKRFVQLKEQTKSHNPNKSRTPPNHQQQKHRREPKRSQLRVGDSVVKQLPKEPEEAFLARASKLQQDRVIEAKFSSKFNVDIERDESTGAVRLKKRKTHEIDELLKKKAEETKGFKKKKKVKQEKKKLTLAEKKSLKKQKIEEKKRNEDDKLLEEYQVDKVAFGEVVNGPPTLNTKPRNADKLKGAPRPGKKRLLLHSLLDPSEEEDAEPEKKKPKKKAQDQQKVNLKGKRKNLPIGTRINLEREQQNVIDMYRQLRKTKQQSS